MILADIDGTLLPYADNKFRHLYRCECGDELMATSLHKSLPAFCSSCAGSTFKRNESSLAECRSIVKEILIRNIPPYPGAKGKDGRALRPKDQGFNFGLRAWFRKMVTLGCFGRGKPSATSDIP